MKTDKKMVSVYTELTPNPETMKFITNQPLYPGKNIDFPEEGDAWPSPLAQELFAFPFIKGVFIAAGFVTMTKTRESKWEEVTPALRQFLKEYLEDGKPIIDEDKVAKQIQDRNSINSNDTDIVKRIKEILEHYVKPAVEMDGGAIKYLGYNDGTVRVMLQGSCSGCPSSMITLKAGVEGLMKRMIPEVKIVEAEVG